MKISAGNGTTWRVRRRVTPWRRRLRGHLDIPDLGGGDDILGLIGLIVAVPFLIVAAVALSELLLLLLLIPAYVLVRVAMRRPWAVDVHQGDEHVATESVVGWRLAGERAQQIAELIRTQGRYGVALAAPAAPDTDPLAVLRAALGSADEVAVADRLGRTAASRAALEHACVWDKDHDLRLAAARAIEASNRPLAVQTYETVIQDAGAEPVRPMTRDAVAALAAQGRVVHAAALRLAVLDGN